MGEEKLHYHVKREEPTGQLVLFIMQAYSEVRFKHEWAATQVSIALDLPQINNFQFHRNERTGKVKNIMVYPESPEEEKAFMAACPAFVKDGGLTFKRHSKEAKKVAEAAGKLPEHIRFNRFLINKIIETTGETYTDEDIVKHCSPATFPLQDGGLIISFPKTWEGHRKVFEKVGFTMVTEVEARALQLDTIEKMNNKVELTPAAT